MEIGNNTSDPTKETSVNPTNPFQNKRLIVNLRYDGLSMLVFEAERKQLLQIHESSWAPDKDSSHLSQQISQFFSENSFDISSAASVLWVLSLSKFTLVPDVLFQEDESARLMKYTSRLGPDEEVQTDFWSHQELIALYSLPKALKELALSLNKRATFSHSGFSFNALQQLQTPKEEFCHLQISKGFAELVLYKGGKLSFFNQLPYTTKEDLVYMLLSALEQNRILAPELSLKCGGQIQKGDELHKLLSNYVGEIKEIGLPPGLSSARDITPQQLRKTAHLIACL